MMTKQDERLVDIIEQQQRLIERLCQCETSDRLAALEQWREQVEQVWPNIGENNGTD